MGIEWTVKRKKQVLKQKVFSHRCSSTRWWEDRSVTAAPVPAGQELSVLAFSKSGKLLIVIKSQKCRVLCQDTLVTLAVFPPTMLSTQISRGLCATIRELRDMHNVCRSHCVSNTSEIHTIQLNRSESFSLFQPTLISLTDMQLELCGCGSNCALLVSKLKPITKSQDAFRFETMK